MISAARVPCTIHPDGTVGIVHAITGQPYKLPPGTSFEIVRGRPYVAAMVSEFDEDGNALVTFGGWIECWVNLAADLTPRERNCVRDTLTRHAVPRPLRVFEPELAVA
jgi:hypothetical protein